MVIVTFSCSNAQHFLSNVIKPHSTFPAVFCLPLRPFSLFEKSMTNFKHSKVKEKSFFLLMLEWQAELTGRYREPTERDRRKTGCLCIMHIHFRSHVHRKTSTPKRTKPLTLPKHCLTWQIRLCWACCFFDIADMCHISVRASHGFTSRKESQKEPTCHLASLSRTVRLLVPVLLYWVLSNEAGIGSRSQHHMLNNSQSPVVIAETFLYKIQE